jgi:excisionase family DNA binding protein
MTDFSQSQSAWLMPAQSAKQLAISPNKVHTWIANGELRAVNVAERRHGRPRRRISPEALEEFLRRRESKPPPPRLHGHRSYTPRNGAGLVVREDDGRLAKNTPHEVRVMRMAKLMAASQFGYGAEWRPFLQKAVARYAERNGIQVDERAVLALEE